MPRLAALYCASSDSELYTDSESSSGSSSEDEVEELQLPEPDVVAAATEAEIPLKVDFVKPVDEKNRKGIRTRWAIDDEQDISDFHERVPDMAIKYPFELMVFKNARCYI